MYPPCFTSCGWAESEALFGCSWQPNQAVMLQGPRIGVSWAGNVKTVEQFKASFFFRPVTSIVTNWHGLTSHILVIWFPANGQRHLLICWSWRHQRNYYIFVDSFILIWTLWAKSFGRKSFIKTEECTDSAFSAHTSRTPSLRDTLCLPPSRTFLFRHYFDVIVDHIRLWL